MICVECGKKHTWKKFGYISVYMWGIDVTPHYPTCYSCLYDSTVGGGE